MQAVPSRRGVRRRVVLGALALALVVAPSAFGQFQVDGHGHEGELSDLDTRTATIAPSPAQLDAVAALGATARWTDFGTAQSLIRQGGFLASGDDDAKGSTPIVAPCTGQGHVHARGGQAAKGAPGGVRDDHVGERQPQAPRLKATSATN